MNDRDDYAVSYLLNRLQKDPEFLLQNLGAFVKDENERAELSGDYSRIELIEKFGRLAVNYL